MSPSGSPTPSPRPTPARRSSRSSSGPTARPTPRRRSSTGLAARDPRIRLLALPRRGQTATQAALFEAARGEAVVLTDAETRFAPGCLAALAEALRDPRVGCVTGRLEWRDEAATATSAQEGLYWRYERRVREIESRAGLLTAVTGALFAVRASAYRSVPPTASMDHLLPLYVREAGGLVMYVPAAVATDRPISGLREQFRNRTRTATRGIRANLSMVGPLAPWRRPGPGGRHLVAQAPALGDAVVRARRGGRRARPRRGAVAGLPRRARSRSSRSALVAAARPPADRVRSAPAAARRVRPLVRGRQPRLRGGLGQRRRAAARSRSGTGPSSGSKADAYRCRRRRPRPEGT